MQAVPEKRGCACWYKQAGQWRNARLLMAAMAKDSNGTLQLGGREPWERAKRPVSCGVNMAYGSTHMQMHITRRGDTTYLCMHVAGSVPWAEVPVGCCAPASTAVCEYARMYVRTHIQLPCSTVGATHLLAIRRAGWSPGHSTCRGHQARVPYECQLTDM